MSKRKHTKTLTPVVEAGRIMGMLVELLTKHEMTCWASRDGKVYTLREKIGGGKPYPLYLHRAPTLAGAVQLAWKAMEAKVHGAASR